MKPGRELDALVAEKVMGFSIDPGLPSSAPGLKDYGTAFLYPPEWDEELGAWPSTRGRQAEHVWDYVPHFSTSIADAWQVMERLWEDAPSFFVRPDEKDGVQGYSVGEIDAFLEVQPDFVFGETAPHAICLAALAAVSTTDE